MPQGGPPWASSGASSGDEGRPPGYAVSGVLRSVLRWPAAVALALCGLSHLPVNSSHLQGAQTTAGLSMAIAIVYLLLAGWLAMRDTALVWTVSAAAAMIIIALHALSRAGVFAPTGQRPGRDGYVARADRRGTGDRQRRARGRGAALPPAPGGSGRRARLAGDGATAAKGAGRDPDRVSARALGGR